MKIVNKSCENKTKIDIDNYLMKKRIYGENIVDIDTGILKNIAI